LKKKSKLGKTISKKKKHHCQVSKKASQRLRREGEQGGRGFFQRKGGTPDTNTRLIRLKKGKTVNLRSAGEKKALLLKTGREKKVAFWWGGNKMTSSGEAKGAHKREREVAYLTREGEAPFRKIVG